ncbi:YggT family protein [Thalassobaculum sp.]|uniref:YggT family protein n=1 Tax=Thalassobaculum sp. TaxID=2022740 RepID=UPI0032EDAB7A
MDSVLWLIKQVVQLYTYLLFAYIVIDLLVKFGVLNAYNRVVYVVMDFLSRITEPALRPIRNLMPNLGGIDISPVILVLALQFGVRLLEELAIRMG